MNASSSATSRPPSVAGSSRGGSGAGGIRGGGAPLIGGMNRGSAGGRYGGAQNRGGSGSRGVGGSRGYNNGKSKASAGFEIFHSYKECKNSLGGQISLLDGADETNAKKISQTVPPIVSE